jgi:phage terminase large subunit
VHTLWTKYFETARNSGVPRDQLENFIRAFLVLQPRQLAASACARACDEPTGPDSVGYGGARAGGKSHWLLAQMGADDCQRRPGLQCLLLRKVGKANLEHFEALRRKIFGHLRHEFNGSRGILTFENGSRIIAGHFQCEKDIDSYLGLEYDVIGVEEATTLTERKYRDISTCCRTARTDFRPRIYSTTNPGGVGHEWYKRMFIAPRPGESRTRFISAKLTDNRFTNADYGRQLAQLTGWQRRAWLDGDWDIAAGQFFTSFRQEMHVRADFDERRARRWIAALDYGFSHYTVFLLAAEDPQGVVHVVDEHAERGWLPERHARAIGALVARHAGDARSCLRSVAAGTDVFAKQYDGSCIAREYAKFGISLKPAVTDRINGWAEILRRLGDPQAGIAPKLYIHPRCRRLIGCLPALQHDPSRPEDVLKVDVDDENGEGGDDAADCLRYLLCKNPIRLKDLRLLW